jgi:hypothetical protein
MTDSVASEILKASCFPPFSFFFFFFYSSAAAALEEGMTTALAAKAAGVGRAASSVGPMAVKPTTLIMLGNVGVMLAEVSKGFFWTLFFC